MEIPKERPCTKCGEVKPLTDEFFYPQVGYKYGLTRWCRDCRTKYSVGLNKEKRDEYRTENARKNRGLQPDKYRLREFIREMRGYGTTVEWYRDKLIEQLGVCALCGHLNYFKGELRRLTVDHDHKCCDRNAKSCGKCLRSLLCGDCNTTLGYVERWAGLPEMYRALQYLDKYKNPWLSYPGKLCEPTPEKFRLRSTAIAA